MSQMCKQAIPRNRTAGLDPPQGHRHQLAATRLERLLHDLQGTEFPGTGKKPGLKCLIGNSQHGMTFLISSSNDRISAAGSGARTSIPEKAAPQRPVLSSWRISPGTTPPIATTGMLIPSSLS